MITVDAYVMNCIKHYPSLYSAPSYYKAKMKVLDQLLNVIGNGIRDNEELIEQLEMTDTNITMDDIAKHVSGEKLFYGYTKVTTYEEDGKVVFTSPDRTGKSYNGVLESEKDQYPDVVYWIECSYNEHKPYPNFKEEYSTIYKCPRYLKLDPSFIEAAIEFYEYVKEWFNDNEAHYSYAFPCATKQETDRRLKEIKQYMTKYKTWDEISEAYGIEYKGDLYQLQIDRWTKEKKRIFQFIEKTLTLLKENI